MNAKQHVTSITLIGAGNVAHNLALSFQKEGYSVREVYSRTKASAMELAHRLNCNYTTDLADLRSDTDLFVLSVHDDALPEVLDQIKIKNKPIVHTSGSTGIEIFENRNIDHFGIFYPVQSFLKNEQEELTRIPICIEANNSVTEELLLHFANSLSTSVFKMDSEKRKTLHVAAVFANNFSNHMFHIAYDLLNQQQLPFDLIRPLLEKTAEKIKHDLPMNVQTGPAMRNDNKIIQEHLKYLNEQKDYQELYKLITENIFETQQQKNG